MEMRVNAWTRMKMSNFRYKWFGNMMIENRISLLAKYTYRTSLSIRHNRKIKQPAKKQRLQPGTHNSEERKS